MSEMDKLIHELLDWIELDPEPFCKKYEYAYGQSVPAQMRDRYAVAIEKMRDHYRKEQESGRLGGMYPWGPNREGE